MFLRSHYYYTNIMFMSHFYNDVRVINIDEWKHFYNKSCKSDLKPREAIMSDWLLVLFLWFMTKQNLSLTWYEM